MLNNHIWHLISRKLSGEATLEELRELQQLLKHDPETAYRVELYSNFFEHPVQQQRSSEQKNTQWQKLQSKLSEEFPADFPGDTASEALQSRPSVFYLYKKWMAAAAVLLVITVSAIYFLQKSDKAQDVVSAAVINEMNTMPGTRSKTVLPDGTIVWLNSDSRITYNAHFGETRREVFLIGEAFFDVAHNADVPMVVHTKNVNIWVKGTAFNVRSYPESNRVETSLIRGAVELTTNADPERKIMLKPNEKIVLEAVEPDTAAHAAVRSSRPEHASVKQNLYHIQQLDGSRYNVIPEISWVQNELVFDNEVFTEVISKMEKWYNVEIVLENKELANKNFSGAFKKEDITTALQGLQFINSFQFEIKDNIVYIK
ncbi:MAG: FecR family protein [Chitinophagaceae bacterium]|nr:FecR family protein [Chitinophagaceae bacterium]